MNKSESHFIGAEIDGDFDCTGGTFLNPRSAALVADASIIREDVKFCHESMSRTPGPSFKATGEVSLVGAEISGSLRCSGDVFTNPKRVAISADWSPSAQVGQLEVIEEERICGSSLTAEGAGEVRAAAGLLSPGRHTHRLFSRHASSPLRYVYFASRSPRDTMPVAIMIGEPKQEIGGVELWTVWLLATEGVWLACNALKVAPTENCSSC
jgi:hypothetical protein